jgi:hypothetical protein
MIEALVRTLALFVPPEKPQVSPALAASFIRIGQLNPIFRGVVSTDVVSNAGIKGVTGLDLCLFLLAFWHNRQATPSPHGVHGEDLQAVLKARKELLTFAACRFQRFDFV